MGLRWMWSLLVHLRWELTSKRLMFFCGIVVCLFGFLQLLKLFEVYYLTQSRKPKEAHVGQDPRSVILGRVDVHLNQSWRYWSSLQSPPSCEYHPFRIATPHHSHGQSSSTKQTNPQRFLFDCHWFSSPIATGKLFYPYWEIDWVWSCPQVLSTPLLEKLLKHFKPLLFCVCESGNDKDPHHRVLSSKIIPFAFFLATCDLALPSSSLCL